MMYPPSSTMTRHISPSSAVSSSARRSARCPARSVRSIRLMRCSSSGVASASGVADVICASIGRHVEESCVFHPTPFALSVQSAVRRISDSRFHGLHRGGKALPGGVVATTAAPYEILDLIFADLSNREVGRFGMRKVETGDRSGRQHGVVFAEPHSDLRCLEQLEQLRLDRMIRTGGIAGRGSNATVLLPDEL